MYDHRPSSYKSRQISGLAQISEARNQQQARRIARMAKVLVVAAKLDITSKQRRRQKQKKQFYNLGSELAANKYRLVASCLLILFTVVNVLNPLLEADKARNIKVGNLSKTLIGDSRDDVSAHLTYDPNNKLHKFELPKIEKTETSEHTGRKADSYTATIPDKASAGITVTDSSSNIAVTLTPSFFTTKAQKAEGNHLVYKSGERQLIYTFKYNGLKEDIIIPSFQSDDMQFRFKLSLPSGVEARLDDDGNIGIYSSDPSLFGNISFGSDEDRERVEKARQNSEKANLVMKIPFPVVKDSTGTEYTDRSEFKLANYKIEKKSQAVKGLPEDAPTSLVSFNTYDLTVIANNLKTLSYPISIDPTMQVTSSADFGNLDQESGTQLDTTNNLIKRAGLTGGAVGSWSQQADYLPSNAGSHNQATVHNGHLYMVGGVTIAGPSDANALNTVWSAPINTDGSLGTLKTDNPTLPVISNNGVVVAANGFLYLMSGNGPNANVYYAKIQPDKSVGAWTATTSLTTARIQATTAYVNGRIYVIGGCSNFVTNCTQTTGSVEYTTPQADGSIASWSTTTAATSSFAHGSWAYNNFIYRMGGSTCSVTCSVNTTTEYARVQPDGTLSSWTSTTGQPDTGVAHSTRAYGGYAYYVSRSTQTTTVYYAALYGNGAMGAWQTTTSYTTGRYSQSFIIHDGKLIIVGGVSGANGSFVGHKDVQYANIRPAGWTTSWAEDTGGNFTTARFGHGTIAYNGYLYVLGGCTTAFCDTGSELTNTVYYAPINTDGSIGTWSSTTNIGTARYFFGLTAHNGYIYITGGYTRQVITEDRVVQGDTIYAPINADGTLGSWTTDSGGNFTTPRGTHASEAFNGYLYVIAGLEGAAASPSNALATVQYAPLNADGSVGSWAATASLTTKRSATSVTIFGGRLYVSGGRDEASNFVTSVEYASVNNNGTIDSWTTDTGTSFSNGRFTHLSEASKGYLYIYAGANASTSYGDVQYAPINTDGSIGDWTTLPSMGATRFAGGGIIYRDILYATGGCSETACTTPLATTEFSITFNGGSGTTAAFTTDTGGNMATARTDQAGVVYNGYIYVTGGTNTSGTPVTSVQYAPINTDGTVGAWQAGAALSEAAYRHAAVVSNGYLYVIGGITTTNNTKLVQYASINGDGSVGSWSTDTTDLLSVGRSQFGAAAYNGRIYVVGSRTGGGTSTVEYASANSNGTLSAWQSASSLNTARGRNATVQYNGYLYAIAGCTDDTAVCATTAVIGSVEVAKINADGTLGAWKYTAARPAVWSSSAVAYNGMLYSAGGYGALSTVYAASIGSAGDLGEWNISPTTLPQGRYLPTLTAAHGYLYATAGGSSGAANSGTDTTYYAAINSSPRKANLSILYDFGTGVKPTKLITRGTKQNGAVVGVSYSSTNFATGSVTLNNTQNVTDTGYGGSQAPTLTLGTNRTLSRYLLLRYTIDDSQSAVFPDADNESNITDFDLYYTSNPGSRLRGGRTFTNGVDRGLDVAPQ